ncbi:hypothetical protein [Pectobacterium brasiliense]|uniref:hypothetical protein n=1 Tax=Pectobacterium brasiliense TaxID=180957 RepID=UPI0019695B91|nr:hypothetical protein [Pectobacterium brasiliense]MBN3263005.1 hypothetical protein [Pectobacterium brasiliense]
MKNNTLNTLICQRAMDLLQEYGWPKHTEVDQPSESDWSGWIAVYVRLTADDLVAWLSRMAETHKPDLTKVQFHALLSAARKLERSEALIVLSGNHHVAPPMMPGDNTHITFPYAFEWLTEPEILAVLTCIRCAINRVCGQVLKDARRIRAAVVPSANPHLFTRSSRNFSVIGEESDDESWIDKDCPDNVQLVLKAILDDGARYCCVRLKVVVKGSHRVWGEYSMTDQLRYPGKGVYAWLCFDALNKAIWNARFALRKSNWKLKGKR